VTGLTPSGKRRWCRAGAVLCMLLACACTLWAAPLQVASQTAPPRQAPERDKDYALIYGTVWGPDDRPAVGVPITIRSAADKKPKWKLVSDRRGEFAQRVPAGKQDYIVQADIKMPKGEPKPEMTVKVDSNEREDVGLHLKVAPATK
jgi:hypothetical protein